MQYSKEQLRSYSRELLKHEDVLKYVIEQVGKENTKRIEEDSSFKMAKQYIRQEGIKEGALLVLQKLNRYAGEN